VIRRALSAATTKKRKRKREEEGRKKKRRKEMLQRENHWPLTLLALFTLFLNPNISNLLIFEI